jgi:hypothetical protein
VYVLRKACWTSIPGDNQHQLSFVLGKTFHASDERSSQRMHGVHTFERADSEPIEKAIG